MKWFDKWFQKQSKKAWEATHNDVAPSNRYDSYPQLGIQSGPAKVEIVPELRSTASSQLRMHKAHGGIVVEISTFDSHYESTSRDLYIIPEGASMSEELASIVMQHGLRND